MEMYEIYVPTLGNNGKPFRTRHHKEWDRRVRRITKGLTVFKPVKGQWISPTGDFFEERMIPVRIACTREQIIRISEMTITHYKQLAVIAYKISDDVIFTYPKTP